MQISDANRRLRGGQSGYCYPIAEMLLWSCDASVRDQHMRAH